MMQFGLTSKRRFDRRGASSAHCKEDFPMIDILRALRAQPANGRRLLGFIPALVVTEMFYKFHSFSLECMALLATWLLLDVLIEWIMGCLKVKNLSSARSDGVATLNGKDIDR
jgi:hypothetical protein